MAIWLGPEAQPSSTLEARSYGLESVNEYHVSLASPEDLPEHPDYFDFGHHQKQPKRNPTFPPSPSEVHNFKSLGRARNLYHFDQKRRVVPPLSKRHVQTKPSLTGPHRIRHSSTIDTNNSESFEHTAVWDQKAILSLGMSSPQTLVNMHNNTALSSKPSLSAFTPCCDLFGSVQLGRCDKRLSRSVSSNTC